MKPIISLVTTHLDREYLSLLMDAQTEIPDEANFKSETSDEPMENSASENKSDDKEANYEKESIFEVQRIPQPSMSQKQDPRLNEQDMMVVKNLTFPVKFLGTVGLPSCRALLSSSAEEVTNQPGILRFVLIV